MRVSSVPLKAAQPAKSVVMHMCPGDETGPKPALGASPFDTTLRFLSLFQWPFHAFEYNFLSFGRILLMSSIFSSADNTISVFQTMFNICIIPTCVYYVYIKFQ